MAVEHFNPSGVAPIDNVSQVSVATGSKIVFFAGQVGSKPDGSPAGDDLRSQTKQALQNLQTCADSVSVTSADIAKLTIYVKDYSAERFDEFMAGFGDYLEDGSTVASASAATLVGVATLFEPWSLVELDVIAVTA
jgi:enamine deaminase RidA (YjgF/YER057c/UK114 family)